jgi:hypothetical protein
MVATYLYLNAGLYVLFAVWQTLSPWQTSTSLGFLTLSSSGRSEYLVIYGGLQLGLAAFFIYTALSQSTHRLGLIFAACTYAPIVLYRVATVARFWPVKSLTISVAALEFALLVLALLLLAQTNR